MARKPSKPSFLWQAMLILLPVVVLAVIGWASLRQDKVLAEQDARQRAQVIADQLLPTFQAQLTNVPTGDSSNRVVFRVDEFGRLLSPPPCDPAPAPHPPSLSELSAGQMRLWVESQKSAGTTADAVIAYRSFIDSNPPEQFAAIACYNLGLLLFQQNDPAEAVKALDPLRTRYPHATGESGLPLLPLAELKMIEIQPSAVAPGASRYKLTRSRGMADQNGISFPDVSIDLKYFVSVDSFCSNIVCNPTILTPFLLGQLAAEQTNEIVEVGKWQQTWERDERNRELFAAASEHLPGKSPILPVSTDQVKQPAISSPRYFWFTVPQHGRFLTSASGSGQVFITDENWIATRADDGTNGMFVCCLESELGSSLTRQTEHVPSYFGVSLEIAGKTVRAHAPSLASWHNAYLAGSNSKTSGQSWKKIYSDTATTNLLAFASNPEATMNGLKINVYLTNPAELFATQKSRAILFGLLIVVSTIAALVGLFMAARAFQRQLRLAEMKSNFVSSVSHELRAPIASVRLMAESLERGKVNEPQKQNEYFRFIVQECRRLSSLIENVLDFSRIEQGRKQYEFEPTDLAALTRETVKLMEPYAEEKGVALKFETSSSQLRTSNFELEVDGRALQQALVNLMDNAIKHSAKGQTVTMGLDYGDPVQLYVEDHGAGIPITEHEKIFERFYRLGSELRRETQGVGIGLSIVRHIVAAHGGQVTVRSNIGEGSRFTIVLPVKKSETTDKHR